MGKTVTVVHDRHGDPGARPIVVQKYGGSSVADSDKIGKVADRIVATRRAGNDVVVVVSAMGKTTDQLLDLARSVAPTGEPPRRELDMLVSTGERVAMSLLSIAIQARGEDAISFTGSQCGIITNDRHFDARIIEVRPHRIEDELARGRIVIVAGYQGMSYRREITTLGRGGSDTTAVALAAALGAERCEIYSDVDGVYSADPRAVPEAAHLPEVDYDTLQQMAECGAKVLCAQAVEFARRAGIALYAKSTFGSEARFTLVHQRPAAGVRAVSADPHVALLAVDGGEELGALLDRAGAFQLRAAEISAHGAGAAVLVSRLSAPDWPAAARGLGALARVREDVASVSVVGGALHDDPSTLGRFRRALAAAGAEPALLVASALRITAVIDAERSADVQRGLHRELVEER